MWILQSLTMTNEIWMLWYVKFWPLNVICHHTYLMIFDNWSLEANEHITC
jgi:hypothetical protein